MKKLFILILSLFFFGANAQGLKISQLPVAGPVTGSELTIVVQDGVTKQSTIAAVSPLQFTNWSGAKQYATGNSVIFNNNIYTANTTPTLGDNPDGNSQWTLQVINTVPYTYGNWGVFRAPTMGNVGSALDKITDTINHLKGGTSGQVLTKNSSTKYDYSWVTPSGGSFLPLAGGTANDSLGDKSISTVARYLYRHWTCDSTLSANAFALGSNEVIKDLAGSVRFGSLTNAGAISFWTGGIKVMEAGYADFLTFNGTSGTIFQRNGSEAMRITADGLGNPVIITNAPFYENGVGTKTANMFSRNMYGSWKLDSMYVDPLSIATYGQIPISGSKSQSLTAGTTITVTLPITMPNNTYKVNITATDSVLGIGGYVTNKTTTTYDYVLPVTTGTVTFDWAVFR